MTPSPPAPEAEPHLEARLWRRRWKTAFIFALFLVVFHGMDRLLLGRWLPAALLLRVGWASQMLGYVALWQRLGAGWADRLAQLNAMLSPVWFLGLIQVLGPGNTPYVHLLPCVPLIVSLVQPWNARPGLISGAVCTVGMFALMVQRESALAAAIWAALVVVSSFFGVYGSTQYRKAQEAVRDMGVERARREALEKLAVAERQRAQTEKMATVGRLAASVMHEVNNPLAFVRSNLEFLRTEVLARPLSGEAQAGEAHAQEARAELIEVFAETREGIERIQQIVSDLRGFSRLDAEEPSECALVDVVRDAARLAGVRLKNVARLQVDIPSELPGVFVTPRRLAQVLLNLLVNAGDALEEAQVRDGEVRVTGVDEGTRVAVLVEDNGPGFPAEVLPHLFEAFFTTKGPDKGTGLGLSLSRELVERFGGTLRAENRPGGGARLRLELPVHARPGPP